MIVETVAFIVIVVVLFGLGSYVVCTSDRRIDYIDKERTKRDRDFYKWM
jgi:hypothetical protein